MADAEHTLRNVLDTILDEKNYKPREIKIKAITSGGANYTSALYLINVISPNRDDLKLFGKVAIVGDKLRSRMNADWFFETERFTYTNLTKIYKSIEDELRIPNEHRYIFPRFYGHNAEFGKETIVIENLIEEGYTSYNRFKSMDWEHASAAIENLAKFHALSFAFAKTFPEEFERLTENMKFKVTSNENMDEATIAVWKNMIEGAVMYVNDDQREAVKKFILNNQQLDKYIKPLGMPVIAHGDYRMSNILFKRQDNTLEAIALDYQTVHAGNPAGDLIYFIFLGSDEEFRQHYFEKLLDHYYKNLDRALERLSIVSSEVYPRTKFYRHVRQTLPLAILLGVMVLPVVTVEAGSAPKVDGDADVTNFVLKPTELFAERFRGIVNDCIRWGVKI